MSPTTSKHSLGESALRTFGQVALVNQAWDNVTVLQVEIIVGAEDIGGYDTSEGRAVLLMVGSIGDINDPLGMGIATVGVVRLAIMNLWEK